MTLGLPLTKSSFVLGTFWNLRINIDGFKSERSDELVTQACEGRSFQLVDSFNKDFSGKKSIDRVKVRLMEDDYVCWFNFSDLANNAFRRTSWIPNLLTKEQIFSKIPQILKWTEDVAKKSNIYLWGGTLGPDFDCSGLVQTAYANSGIWIPRDAYQQEIFCKNSELSIDSLPNKLLPGDLLFFGSPQKCTHVGLHIENGLYWHSSGLTNGHNGIEIDDLFSSEVGTVGSFYRSRFRSAGRVISCYESKTHSDY